MLKKQVYEVDSDGFLTEIYVADVDGDGNIQDEDKKNCISVDPPHGLYKPKWGGSEWVEGATEEEIQNIKESGSAQILAPIETLAIDLSERETQEIIQYRQISDLEIRLLMLEVGRV